MGAKIANFYFCNCFLRDIEREHSTLFSLHLNLELSFLYFLLSCPTVRPCKFYNAFYVMYCTVYHWVASMYIFKHIFLYLFSRLRLTGGNYFQKGAFWTLFKISRYRPKEVETSEKPPVTLSASLLGKIPCLFALSINIASRNYITLL